MSTYRTVTRMTDSGPYIIKLILNLRWKRTNRQPLVWSLTLLTATSARS